MIYDIAIVGAGPAGLTAAVYARRADKTVLLIEKDSFGGQITFSPRVENIPGQPPASGNDFAAKLVDQAADLGAELLPAEVLKIEDGDVKTVVTDDGNYQAKAVIIAAGAAHRKLGVEGEDRYIGEGISFCAVCDGAFYQGKTVGVVGGGNSGLQEALLLSGLCKKVIIIQNLPGLTGEEALKNQVAERENIEIITDSVVTGFTGEKALDGVIINRRGKSVKIPLDGLFVAIGLEPKNEIFSELIDLDGLGYADSDESCVTRSAGIFVAGDCRKKTVRQVTTACADGSVAALAACRYLDSKK